ncbi:hypothetical protein LQZ19_05220 [Treponema primitia]|uniref:hypothetical protein n=1 Tax=Treponema primitia TaxID=88058 RepID=UPI00397FBC32
MGKWTKKVEEKEYKISEENAEAAVREFLDYFETGLPSDTTEETEQSADMFFSRLVDAYRRGQLENKMDENLGFCVIQNIKGRESVTYREFKTKDRSILEKYSDTQAESRAIALMGKLSGYGEDFIKSFSAPDFRVCMALAALYFLV